MNPPLALGILFLLAISWMLCPTIKAQIYPKCPRTATDTEQNRLEIRDTSRKFVQILERYQNRPVEIVFVLDSSGSVGSGNFGCEVQFVRHFSKLFSVSPETSRVAVVTYSSCNKIYTDLDYINSPVGKNKCTLLGTDLPRVYYRGGGRCTAYALRRAHSLLVASRPSTQKIVFILIAGQSNDGGSPLTVAAELRNIATVFAIGLGDGINVDELNGIATSPSSDHVFLLTHLTDVETLAEKVIGDQADMVSWDRNVPSDLCNSLCWGSNCCDSRATCSCATRIGIYGCACHPGYTGDGRLDQCTACPRGAFKSQYGNQGCTSCPTLSTTAAEGSTSLNACECLPGHRGSPSAQVPCTPITCQQLSFPESSGVLLVPPNCGNLYGTECRMQCLPNYRPQPGTTDQLTCLANGQWSDTPLQCNEITCPALSAPTNGRLSCDTTDWRIGTVCNLMCSVGYEREGYFQRRCELNPAQVGEWSNKVGNCKAKTCPALLSKQRMRVQPASCETKPQEYTSECYYECIEGFRLEGVGLKTCQADGTWSNSSVEIKCIDIQPPEFTSCPVNISVVTDRNQNFANVSWDQPTARDNAGEPRVEASAAASQERFYLGQTTITYTAHDDVGMETNCTFNVTVEDREPPKIIYCPDNIKVESSEIQTSVNWTAPTFKDNSGEPIQTTFNRAPGSHFSYGPPEHIWYRAKDGAGNAAFCNFTVTVRQYPCPYFPPPQNGALACETWLGGKFCRVACNENFDFNRTPATEFFCDNSAQWAPSPLSFDNPADFSVPWPDCTEMRNLTVEVTPRDQFYVGDCQLDENAKAQIAADFVARFQQLNQLLPGFCQADYGCTVENVEVACGDMTQEGEDISRTSKQRHQNISAADEAQRINSGADGRQHCSEPPSIENGSFESYNRGTSVAYLCAKGYMMYAFRGRKRHCRDGRWSGSTPICSAVGCSEEDAPAVLNSVVQRFNEGTIRFHRCNVGFERQGEGSMVIYCDGARWRNQPGRCVRASSSLCGPAPHVEHATQTMQPNGLITYTCEPGYRRRLGGGSIRCSADGQWIGSPGVCIRQGCVVPRTDSIQNGIINIKQSGAVLKIGCQAGYEMRGSSVLYCNGRQWNGTLPTCTATRYPAFIRNGTRCGSSIPTVSNADLRYAHKKDAEGRLFYALVYSCHRGHTLRPANYAVYCSGGNVVGTLPNCLATCGYNNGGCQHVCRGGPNSAVCSCRDGYQLAPDGKSCRDINECLANNGRGPCQHICYNSPGSFSCYCHSGFTLAQDKASCLPTCGPGTFSATGLHPCQPCPLGSYQPAEQQTHCITCSGSQTTAVYGATSEEECTGNE